LPPRASGIYAQGGRVRAPPPEPNSAARRVRRPWLSPHSTKRRVLVEGRPPVEGRHQKAEIEKVVGWQRVSGVQPVTVTRRNAFVRHDINLDGWACGKAVNVAADGRCKAGNARTLCYRYAQRAAR